MYAISFGLPNRFSRNIQFLLPPFRRHVVGIQHGRIYRPGHKAFTLIDGENS